MGKNIYMNADRRPKMQQNKTQLRKQLRKQIKRYVRAGKPK